MKKIFSAVLGLLFTLSAHAQVKTSQLPPANTPLTGAELINVVQTGTSRQTPISNLLIGSFSFKAADGTAALPSYSFLSTPNAGVYRGSDAPCVFNWSTSGLERGCIESGGNFDILTNLTVTGFITGGAFTGTTGTFSGAVSGTTGTFSGAVSGTTGTFTGALSALSASFTNPLLATSGGTGFASYTVGDLLAASTSTALTRISDPVAGSYLRSGGVAALPLWSSLTLPNAATQGDLLVATGANAIGNLTAVAVGSYLRSNGASTAPVYSTTTIPNTAVLGDIWYGSAANVVSALAGNITTTRKFLTQTGTSVISAVPVWNAIVAGDLPGSFSGFAIPSGTATLTAAAGAATTAIRSDANIAIDQTIAPTWTNQHIYTANGGGASSAVYVNSATQPSIGFRDAAGAADSKLWDWTTNGTQVLGRVLNDAQSVARIFLQVDRTATAVTGVTLGNATDNTKITSYEHDIVNTVGHLCPGGTDTAVICLQNNTTGHTAWGLALHPTVAAGNILGMIITGTGNATDTMFRVDGSGGSFQINGFSNITNTVANGVALALTGSANNTTETIVANATASQSFGLSVTAGTNATDYALLVRDVTGATTALKVLGTGAITVPSIGTTASAANVFVDNAASNNLLRSTSSRRYKQDISTMTDATANIIYKLRPVRFHSKASADNHTAWFYGLVAEEVAAVEPSLVVRDEKGRPDGVQYDRLQVFMLPEVQKLRKEVDRLQLQVYALLALGACSIGYTFVKTRRR